MDRLFLINPPSRKGYSNERSLSGGLGVSRKLKPFEKPYLMLPPPDLLLTAAVGEQNGLKASIVDLILENQYQEDAVAYVQNQIGNVANDEVVWVGVRLSIPTLPADIHFSNRLKEQMPNIRLFLFGAVIMSTLDHWITETKADVLLYGEPEAIVGAMFTAQGSTWKRQKGVIVPNGFIPLKGEALYDRSIQNRFHEWVLNDNLTATPYPAYHLLPLERYSPTGKTEDCEVYVTTSRGCPIGCTMCPYMLHEGRPIRSSAANRVLDEMEWLNKTWGIYKWRFRDPNFGFDRKHAKEVLSGVIERGIKMSATVEGSLECMDDPLIELMHKAGVTVITTGIETADADCLNSIGQKIKINDILAKKIAYADSLGIHVYGTFVIGAPEESWVTVKKTIDYAKEVPCECGFTIMTPFPGTPMYYRALEEGLLKKEMVYAQWNSYEATMRSRNLTTFDLTLARLWARLELIIPYLLYRANREGGAALLKTQLKLIPRRMVLMVVRGLVAWRKMRQAEPVEVNPKIKTKKVEKIPLHWS